MIIGGRAFDFENQSYVMAILNMTPDSFSDGGRYNTLERIIEKAGQALRDGAHILDVGGESTRPGHVPISAKEEIARVCPVIESLKSSEFMPDCTVSLDTCKSDVAAAGIAAGADMINDIWGLKWDGAMAKVIADAGVACCLGHNRQDAEYGDVVEDVIRDLQESVDIALAAGIARDKIILDPGIGFAKSYEQNLTLLKHLDRLHGLGYPILLGTSRKSVIGLTIDQPVDNREEGTVATTVMGRMAGCSIFRVHDVKKNLWGLMMTEAVLNAQ